MDFEGSLPLSHLVTSILPVAIIMVIAWLIKEYGYNHNDSD